MRFLIPTFLLLIAGLIAWQLLAGEVAAPPSGHHKTKQQTGTQATRAESASKHGPGQPSGDTAVRSMVAKQADKKVFVIPDDAEWVEVLIVDKVTQEPVADVDVRWINQQQLSHVRQLSPVERFAVSGITEITSEFGWRARSDQNGKVRIVPGAELALVVARIDSRWGADHFGRIDGDAPRLLELVETTSIRALVLDAEGQPAADVSVVIGQHPAPNEPTIGEPNVMSRDTDETGIATFELREGAAKWLDGKNQGHRIAHWQLRLKTHQDSSEHVLVNAQQPQDNPAVLRLGETGQLHVRVLCDGQPLPLPQSVIVMGHALGLAETRDPWKWRRKLDADGWFACNHMPLGQGCTISGPWRVEVAGPVEASSTIRTTVELCDTYAVIKARLLGPDGHALANHEVRASCEWIEGHPQLGEHASDSETLITDVNGILRWPLVNATETSQLKVRTLSFRWYDTRTSPSTTMDAKALSQRVLVGANDFGNLQLTKPPLVVSGQVVFDQPGQHGNWIYIEELHTDGEWHRVEGLDHQYLQDDSFEVRGWVEPGRYRAAIPDFDHLPIAPIEFAIGTEGLVIHGKCGTSVTASALLPEGLTDEWLHFDLVPHGTTASTRTIRARTSNPGRSELELDWPAVPDGAFDLRVTSPFSSARLFELHNVRIPSSSEGKELGPLDLRQHVKVLHLDLQPEGRLTNGVRGARCWRWEAPALPASVANLRWGDHALPVSPTPSRLLIVGHESVPLVLATEQSPAVAKVRDWPTVQLRFTGIDELAEPFSVRVSAESIDPPQYLLRRRVAGAVQVIPNRQLSPLAMAHVYADGTATMSVRDGSSKLLVKLIHRPSDTEAQLSTASPTQVMAGGSYVISLSAEELATASARLLQAAKK